MKVKLPGNIAKIIGPVLIVIAALLWSLDGLLRAELRTIPPAFLVTLEHTLGLIPLLPFLWIYRKNILEASVSAKIAIATTAIISGALGTVFYTAALAEINYVPFSVVVLMQQLQPIFAVSLAAVLLKEKIDYKFVISAIFALVGAYLLTFPELLPDLQSAPGRAQAIAASLALAAALSWGAGTVFSKFALEEIDFRAATALRYVVTIITALIVSIVLGQVVSLDSITSNQWVQLVVIVFSAGTVALLFYYKGLSKTPAKISTFAELAWPLSAFAIDTIRGIDFTNTQLIGALILITMIAQISSQNYLRKANEGE
jgi:drug/metabolite transporter (DMT)-like permease